MAERAERVRQAARELGDPAGAGGQQGDAEARQAASQAAQDLERERIAERMRASAEAMRQASGACVRRAKSPASWRGPWIASPGQLGRPPGRPTARPRSSRTSWRAPASCAIS